MNSPLMRRPMGQLTAWVAMIGAAATAMACSSPPARSFETLTVSADGPANGPWAGPLLEPGSR